MKVLKRLNKVQAASEDERLIKKWVGDIYDSLDNLEKMLEKKKETSEYLGIGQISKILDSMTKGASSIEKHMIRLIKKS